MTGHTLSNFRVSALVAPAMPMFAMMMPLAIFLPSYFASNLGISMATVGTLFLIGRLFDVFTDPLAGIVMDRCQAVISRKLWVAIGALPIAVAVSQLFFVSPAASTAELMTWLIVLYLGWTLMSVGLYSWAAETTHNYHERSRVMGAVQLANSIGSILVLLTPATIELLSTSQDLGTARVNAMGTLILVLLPLTLVICWFFAPPSITATKPTRVSIYPALLSAFREKSLRLVLIADLAVGINLGVSTSLTVFFAEIVLGLDGRAGTLSLATLVAAMVGVPLWVALAERRQKHIALAMTALVTIAGGLFHLWVPPNQFSIFLIGSFLFGLATGGIQFLPRAMMADVLDRERLDTGEERAGLYFSFLTTTLKLGLAIGIGIAFYLSDFFGFDPASARQTTESHHVIRYLIATASFLFGGIIFLAGWIFPLGRNEQQQLRAAIDSRNDGTIEN